MQGAGQAQTNDGEGLVEPLTHRGSRSGMVAFKRTGQVVKTPFPEPRRFTLEGLVQTPRDLGGLVLGQMGEDISPLMHLAALNGSSLAVDLGNGATQRLRPVDDRVPTRFVQECTLSRSSWGFWGQIEGKSLT